MNQILGVQELYLGCFGFGILFVAGSLFLSGSRMKGAGHQAGFRAMHGRIHGANTPRPHIHAAHAGNGIARVSTRVQASGGARTGIRGMKNGSARTARSGANGIKTGQHKAGATAGSATQQDDASMVRRYFNIKGKECDLAESIYFFVLGLLNPFTLAICLFFFGFAGLLIVRAIPFLAQSSYLPASVFALIATVSFQNLLSWLCFKMDNSTVAIMDDAVGAIGEVTVSIPCGKVGEILFVLGQTRRNYPARAISADQELKRGTKAVIVELENNTVLVETFDDGG